MSTNARRTQNGTGNVPVDASQFEKIPRSWAEHGGASTTAEGTNPYGLTQAYHDEDTDELVLKFVRLQFGNDVVVQRVPAVEVQGQVVPETVYEFGPRAFAVVQVFEDGRDDGLEVDETDRDVLREFYGGSA